MMNEQNSRWRKAQKGERRCWEKNISKILSPEYQKKKKEYWNKIINVILSPQEQKELEEKNILDIGCGPSGIVIYFPENHKITCIDPLMDFYLKNFSFLPKSAKYKNMRIEDIEEKNEYDVVFGFNSIDHVDDIPLSLKNIHNILRKDGKMYITLNCHNSSFLQKILIRLSFILDKPHPHQYTADQYEKMLQKSGFSVQKRINIDDITEWINKQTKSPKKKSVKSYLDPGALFFSFLEIIGIRRYGSEKQKTVYSHIAFICRKNNR